MTGSNRCNRVHFLVIPFFSDDLPNVATTTARVEVHNEARHLLRKLAVENR
jgi:hypothetical protein